MVTRHAPQLGWMVGAIAVSIAVATACGSDSESDGALLSDYIRGGGLTSGEESAELERQRQTEVEAKISECMAAEGFEYIPHVDVPDGRGAPFVDLEEFRREYGYGIASGILISGVMFDIGLDDLGAVVPDPNVEIVDNLDPAEAVQYYRALYGDRIDVDVNTVRTPDIGSFLRRASTRACLRASDIAVAEEWSVEQFWQEFATTWNRDVIHAIQADPRVLAMREEWSSCMAQQGYEFERGKDAMQHIVDRLDELVVYEKTPVSEQYRFGLYDLVANEEVEFDRADVEAVLEEEIDMSLADLECDSDSDERYAEIFDEFERAWVQANFERLQPFRLDK